MTIRDGKLILDGIEYENPLDNLPLRKRNGEYAEWKEGERTSFRSIWLDRYLYEKEKNCPSSFESHELKISNRGKCFIDDRELKKSEDISAVKEIFSQLRIE